MSRAAVERIHGDAVTIIPMGRGTDVNASAKPIDGASYASVACFFENTLVENDALSRPMAGQGRLQNAAPSVSASIRLIDEAPLEAGYVLRRESDAREFEIASYKPDGLGTVLAVLNTKRLKP